MSIYTSISSNNTKKFNEVEPEACLRNYISLLTLPVELRIITSSSQGTISGYFDNPKQLIAECEGYSGSVEAVYTTLNPVNPDLMARAKNRTKSRAKHTTADLDITRRVWLPIDCDAVRPAGISATDEQKDAAISVIKEVRDYLTDQGFPPSLLGDSGNGGHALFRVDLPNTPEAADLFRRFLEHLSHRFDSAKVKLDRTVFNAARIWKVYGTKVCKGEEVGDRRHRFARILELPDVLEIVPLELIGKVIGHDKQAVISVPEGRSTVRTDSFERNRGLALRLIEQGGLTVMQEKEYRGGVLWVLDRCPFCELTDGTAHVEIQADGKLCFACKHNRCQDNHWREFRMKCGGEPWSSVIEYRDDTLIPPVESVEAVVDPDDPVTAYLWRGNHARPSNVSEEDRQKRARSVQETFALIPSDGVLPNFLRAYLPTTDGHPIFGVAAGLSLVASMIHRRAWVSFGGRKMTPALWFALMGESGERKSTWAKYAERHLRDMGIPTLTPSSTWAALAEKLGVPLIDNQASDVCGCLLKCREHGEGWTRGCGTLVIDELAGWFKALTNPINGELKEFFTSIYEGLDYYVKETKTQGTYLIYQPTINIIGCSTPQWLAHQISEADILGGFLGRFTFVISPGRDYRLSYPDQPNATAQAAVDSELIRLARHPGGVYAITDDALDEFCSWAKTVKVGDRVEAWRVRITNSVVKLALLLKLSWSDERVIDGDTMTLATRLMSRLVVRLEEYVERHLPTDQDDARCLKVAEIIRKAGRISHQKALKNSHMRTGEFTQMMQTLAEQGDVVFEEEKTAGRPATFYRWVG